MAGVTANETIATEVSGPSAEPHRHCGGGAEAWWQSFSRPFLHYPDRGYLCKIAVRDWAVTASAATVSRRSDGERS